MINLMQLPANEAERLAYSEGFTGAAELFARLSEAEAIVDKLRDVLADVHTGHIPKRELADLLHAYIAGIEFARDEVTA